MSKSEENRFGLGDLVVNPIFRQIKEENNLAYNATLATGVSVFRDLLLVFAFKAVPPITKVVIPNEYSATATAGFCHLIIGGLILLNQVDWGYSIYKSAKIAFPKD